jgi:hypothetical protein
VIVPSLASDALALVIMAGPQGSQTCMLLLAHPLHPHGAARDGAGDQRRICRRIVGAVVAVATRSLDVDAAQGLLGQAQHLGDRLPQREHALRVAPDRELALVHQGDRAGWPDRAVQLVGPAILGLERPDGQLPRGRARRANDEVLGRKLTEGLEQLRLPGQAGALLPGNGAFERPHGLDGLVLALRHHGQVAAVPHQLENAGHALHRRPVERLEGRALVRRPHHAGMHHPGQAQVLHVGDPARDLARNVHARQRLAHDRVVLRLAQFGFGLRREVERIAGDEFAIWQAAPVARHHRAGLCVQGFSRHPEPLRRESDQDLAHLGGGVHDRGAAVLHRMAAGRIALVGGAARIGRHDRHAGGVDAELFGRDLDQRRLDPLPELGLAGEHRDLAVRVDADPGVEHGSLVEAAGQLGRPALARPLASPLGQEPGRPGQPEGHHEAAAQDGAAREGRRRSTHRPCSAIPSPAAAV